MYLVPGFAVATLLVPGVASAAPSVPSLPVSPGSISSAFPGVSAACSTTIASDLTNLFTDLATPPAALPVNVADVISALQTALGRNLTDTELLGVLTSLGLLPTVPAAPANPLPVNTDLTGTDTTTGDTSGAGSGDVAAEADTVPVPTAGDPTQVPADLQQIAADFFRFCVPAAPTLPTGSTTTPASAHSSSPEPVVAADTSTPEVTPAAEQPVSYPGYAATGAIAPASSNHPVDTAPLAALGGAVLLVGGGATAAAVRFRARRSGR